MVKTRLCSSCLDLHASELPSEVPAVADSESCRAYADAVAQQNCQGRSCGRRRAEARESGKLLQDKQALESRVKEMQSILETVQNQRNELKQQFRVSGALEATPRISTDMLLCITRVLAMILHRLFRNATSESVRRQSS